MVTEDNLDLPHSSVNSLLQVALQLCEVADFQSPHESRAGTAYSKYADAIPRTS